MNAKFHLDNMGRPVYESTAPIVVNFSAGLADSQPHSHDYIALILITGGQIVHHHSLRTDVLGEGDVVAVSPGELHWMEGRSNSMYFTVTIDIGLFQNRMIAVNETESFVDTRVMTAEFIQHQYGRMETIHLGKEDLRRARSLCGLMLEEEESPGPGGGIVRRSLFTALLVLLCRKWKDEYGETMMASSDKAALITDVVKYITENYRQSLSIETLASQCFISSDYFRKLFRQNIGMSPLKYINRVRAENAARLLEEGILSVTEVATRTGFNDINNFTRIFKGFFGLTPSDYRKQHMAK